MRDPIAKDRVEHLINHFHITLGMSLRKIERDNGLSNDTLRKAAQRFGIRTKSRNESIRDNMKYLTMPSGPEHWRAKKPDQSKKLSEIHSEIMTNNNPSANDKYKKKIRLSQRDYHAKNPTRHELLMIEFLESIKCPYEFQKICGNYISDFAFGLTLLELDGRGHASREASDLVRDKSLCDLGFNVVRVYQDSVINFRTAKQTFKPAKLMEVIEDLVPSLNFACSLPADGSKYRVVVRKPNPFTETIY